MEKDPKNAYKYSCNNCDYYCRKKSEWDRHIVTAKHRNRTNRTHLAPKIAEDGFTCECGRKYKARNSYWYHKKKCDISTNVGARAEQEKIETDLDYKEMFMELIKKNNEMTDIVLEQQKTIKEMIPNIGNNNNNINNTKLNINLFLNEECKDALNIMDFVNSLKLRMIDLENTGKMGFIEGTSKIIIDGLKQLELHKRPVHCSDLQNEVLYVKDNDKWEQDTNNKDKMKHVIDEVSKANLKQLPKWITDNPTYANDDEYMQIVSNIMKMDDIDICKTEIIKNVSKEVILENE